MTTERAAGLREDCHITRGLDGWRQCAVHGWEGNADEVQRRCPAALAAPAAVDVERAKELVGAVIDRWYHLGLLRFNSRDDGGDDLLLRDEIVRTLTARLPEPVPPEEP